MLARSRKILPHQRAQLEIGRQLGSLIRQIAGGPRGPITPASMQEQIGAARTMLASVIQQEQHIAAILSGPQ
jgi:hypothetical protein